MCLKRLRETVVGNHRSLLLYKGLRGAVSHVSYFTIEYVEVIEKGADVRAYTRIERIEF